MFGFGSIGGGEILAILVLALLLFGPRRIPEIGRSVGKALAQFRRASHEFRSGLEREVEMERLKEAGDTMRSLRDQVRSVPRDVVSAAVGDRPPESSPTEGADPPSEPEGTSSGDAPRRDEEREGSRT